MKKPLAISFIDIKTLCVEGKLSSLLDVHHVLVIKAHAKDFVLKTEQLFAAMSPREKERCERISLKAVALRYLIYRGLLRFLLGLLINEAPKDVELAVGKYGKPSLKSGNDLTFNLSHTDDIVIYTFSKHGEIGVDVERKDAKFSSLNVADLYLTDGEKIHVLALSLDKQMPFLVKLWTKKEAISKAFGLGLNMNLKSLDLSHFEPGHDLMFKFGEDYCHLAEISNLADHYASVALIERRDNILFHQKKP